MQPNQTPSDLSTKPHARLPPSEIPASVSVCLLPPVGCLLLDECLKSVGSQARNHLPCSAHTIPELPHKSSRLERSFQGVPPAISVLYLVARSLPRLTKLHPTITLTLAPTLSMILSLCVTNIVPNLTRLRVIERNSNAVTEYQQPLVFAESECNRPEVQKLPWPEETRSLMTFLWIISPAGAALHSAELNKNRQAIFVLAQRVCVFLGRREIDWDEDLRALELLHNVTSQ
ncbi:hypothetical protein RRG08_048775 [Elysia crispata]|uniref:Uncharacterized protein n=1 Tax=Elysia crispata TaxID=231223 RepID=A0AAE1E1B2_9GAST|nr:hypothetical protein RRG08_048775 [Elysia crispata]